MPHRDTELRQIRLDLLDAFDAISNTTQLWAFQRRLADEISSIEPVAYSDRQSPERDQLRLLRLFGDGLAWRYLHAHSIRQLAKNPAPPPAIYNQSGFAATMDIAREVCEKGAPALVADLTYCLRVSDVIVCADPEHPVLIESGGHPAYANRGRKARQRRRAEAVTELLNNGEVTLPGHAGKTVVFEGGNAAQYHHERVASVVEQALRDGRAWAHLSDGDVLFAMPGDALDGAESKLDIPLDALEVLDRFSRMCTGNHLRLLERPSPLLAPPHVWPLDRRFRAALIEGDVVLVHFLDLDAFCGSLPVSIGRIEDVLVRGGDIEGFKVEAAGVQSQVSPRFLDAVIYGMQTIESARLDIATLMTALLSSLPPEDLEASHSPMVEIESLDELEALMAAQQRGEAPPLVSLPLRLFSLLGQLRNGRRPDV